MSLSFYKRLLTLGESHITLDIWLSWLLSYPTNRLRSRYIVFYSWISTSFPRPPAKRAVAIALINAFAQLGNVAGSYVWNLEENGYRKSYGIVTAMFGTTILGAVAFRIMLSRLNKQLEEQDQAWVTQPDVGQQVMDNPDEALRMQKGFRYIV
jgi:hypothetical protein